MENGTQEGLSAWVAGFKPRAEAKGITPETLAALDDVMFLPDVVARDRKQDEFTKTIWDYLDRAVSADRIANGQAALTKHAALLAEIEQKYQVDAAVIVAIWGLESAFGAVRGDIPTLSALATLAYDGRRGAFFEGELLEALRILQNKETTKDRLRGSWAGAMGHTQFMPTSWARLAVDHDGDGRRNVWGDDPADALASTAAYLAKSGWRYQEPWGFEVRLPAGFDIEQAGRRSQKPFASWAALGVSPVQGAMPANGWGALLLPAGARGPAFLVMDNFGAIETYNIADAYVFAVGQLADRIRGLGPVQAAWPREERMLTLDERKELQRLLTQQGFDAGGDDGKVGPLTLSAVRFWQKANGRSPDGFLTVDMLQALRDAPAIPVQGAAP